MNKLKLKRMPLRKCISCGIKKTKNEFIMVVRSPKNNNSKYFKVLGGNEKKEGRASYICKKLDCFKKAHKNKKLEKIFKSKIEKEIYENLEKMVIANEK